MSKKQLETVRLTASFKLPPQTRLGSLFTIYKQILNELLGYISFRNISSFKRLKKEKYYELRHKYPDLPSHYVYTACQMACSIYKSFRKLKRKGKAKGDKPVFKRDVVMLDDHLFSINLEKRDASIATLNGRVKVKLLHGKYHERFKDWRIGQAWLIKKCNGLFLNVVFSKEVELRNVIDVVGVDVNENNVTLALLDDFDKKITKEKTIRTAYFLKRRKIQSKIKTGKTRRKLLAKYGEREKNRVLDVYHKVANWIVKKALKNNSAIALENLKNIRRKIKYSSEMNGRLHRWSFRKLQLIIEYKAKLNGVPVIYVDAKGTSRTCPICGEKLSPNGHRIMKCKKCGLEADRDVIGACNIRLRGLEKIDVRSSVPRKSPSMKPEGGKTPANNYYQMFQS
ncbi:MAG: RNA-guided endonuclease InsQ/TnpB family protein [Candidatus Freyarchaeota archaeon]